MLSVIKNIFFSLALKLNSFLSLKRAEGLFATWVSKMYFQPQLDAIIGLILVFISENYSHNMPPPSNNQSPRHNCCIINLCIFILNTLCMLNTQFNSKQRKKNEQKKDKFGSFKSCLCGVTCCTMAVRGRIILSISRALIHQTTAVHGLCSIN